MTNRISYSPQDFAKMCEQADRDHESRKLAKLMERVKRQIAEREKAGVKSDVARPIPINEMVTHKLPNRPAPFER